MTEKIQFPKDVFDLMKRSVLTKSLFIGFLCLIMMIPFAMIDSLSYEREQRKMEAIQEINSLWALRQEIIGPMLEVPYKVWQKSNEQDQYGNQKRVLSDSINTAYFLPEQLNVKGKIFPEERYRGIYRTIVYTADLEISGEFTFPDFGKLRFPGEIEIQWEQASFIFIVSDMRGINEDIILEWNRTRQTPKPGAPNNVLPGTISAGVPLDLAKKGNHSFNMHLNLRGSETIGFLPMGRKTMVQLASTWKSPKFVGAFLPKTRTIDKNGFNARWEVFDFNRSFPQQWRGDMSGNWQKNSSAFGLDLYVPVDVYSKTNRSIKYAILFIFMTFVAYFLIFELFNNMRIHPFQYMLVGGALSIFYLLLLSISEHFTFEFAYLVAGIAIVGLTTVYTRFISQKWPLAIVMGGIIASLYGFLYVILSLEDYALLVGSLGLFAVLAAIMIGTRNVDWYSFKLGSIE